jgi:hypothetical protein
LEWHSKQGPHIGTGIPIPIQGLPELISKLGIPRIGMGFIPIWGPTLTLFLLYDITASRERKIARQEKHQLLPHFLILKLKKISIQLLSE